MWRVLLRALLFVGLSCAYRPASLLTLDPEESPDAESQKDYVLEPGAIGIHLDVRTGRIEKVFEGTQARILGLSAGQYIVKVDGKKYSVSRYKKVRAQAMKAKRTWRITVRDAPDTEETLGPCLDYVSRIAGAVGVLLIVAFPLAMDRRRFPSLDIHPLVVNLALSAAALRGCSTFGRDVMEWQLLSFGAQLQRVAFVLRVTGVLWGCLSSKNNPLLHASLRKTLTAKLKVHQVAQWVFFFLTVIFIFLEAWVLYRNPGKSGIWHSLQAVGWVPWYFSILVFGLSLSRIAVAARQQMADVMEALPCDRDQFAERVRDPCTKLLEETSSELATCGVPLVLIACGAACNGARVYDRYYDLIALGHWYDWDDILIRAATICGGLCQLVACAWVVSVGPIQLSLAAKEFDEKLFETRRHDTTLHVEVRTLQEELAKARSSQHLKSCLRLKIFLFSLVVACF